MTAELIFDGVELRSGDTNLLGPVSLKLTGPGLTVIMGPNGAGKSLFLSAAHGLVTPDRGQVTWSGTRATASRASRGFVFQTTPVLRRSVAGNIA
jgi:tungstate transport system ATP-binding protein